MAYSEQRGDEAFGCVGAYRLEGLGAQLFDKIEGDYFTILGIPLSSLYPLSLSNVSFIRSSGAV